MKFSFKNAPEEIDASNGDESPEAFGEDLTSQLDYASCKTGSKLAYPRILRHHVKRH